MPELLSLSEISHNFFISFKTLQNIYKTKLNLVKKLDRNLDRIWDWPNTMPEIKLRRSSIYKKPEIKEQIEQMFR